MSIYFISYLIVVIVSLICVLIGNKLFHPRNSLFIILTYLGFVVFLLGRFYELSRVILGLDLYNVFELGSFGIIGALSFWLSSNLSIKQEVDIKATKSVTVKSILVSVLIGLLYFVDIFGELTYLEYFIDFIVVLYCASNIYYFTRHLLLIEEDKTQLLKGLKLYNISGIILSVLVILLFLSFAYSSQILLLIVSILMCIDLLEMIIAFKKGVAKWKKEN